MASHYCITVCCCLQSYHTIYFNSPQRKRDGKHSRCKSIALINVIHTHVVVLAASLCTLSLIKLLLKQRDEVSRNMYFVVWYLPIYTCMVGGNGECASEGAEKLVLEVTGNRSSWKPSTEVRGYPQVPNRVRPNLHSHPRVGREEWQTTRSLRLAKFA